MALCLARTEHEDLSSVHASVRHLAPARGRGTLQVDVRAACLSAVWVQLLGTLCDSSGHCLNSRVHTRRGAACLCASLIEELPDFCFCNLLCQLLQASGPLHILPC